MPGTYQDALSHCARRRLPRLLIPSQADCEIGLEDGGDVGRPDPGAVTPEVDDLTVGGVEGAGLAGVPALAQGEVVASGFDLRLCRVVVRQRADRLAIDQDLKPSSPKL